MKDYILSKKRRLSLLTIARQCKELRRLAGITQAEVADDCGCSKSNVSEFENGRNDSATIYRWYIHYADVMGYAQINGRWVKNGKQIND